MFRRRFLGLFRTLDCTVHLHGNVQRFKKKTKKTNPSRTIRVTAAHRSRSEREAVLVQLMKSRQNVKYHSTPFTPNVFVLTPPFYIHGILCYLNKLKPNKSDSFWQVENHVSFSGSGRRSAGRCVNPISQSFRLILLEAINATPRLLQQLVNLS